MKKLITADCNWMCGHLRYGHWELELSDEEFKFFNLMNEKDQARYIENNGNLIVDDYEIDDCGEPSNIRIF